MNCPQCQHECRSDAQFCESCGARLARACARCGQPAGARARFCSACGAPLADAPLQDEGAHAASSAGERRHLTVLFADLMGSTELAGGMDPEEWRDLVHGFQKDAGAIVMRFGGHVAQHLGDGLLAYFGWPQAHEDAAERAVRAALAIVEAVHGDPPAGEAAPQLRPLRVRIGIHSGPVVVSEIGAAGRAETLALGEAPNIAARVQASCEAGEVLITAATHRLVSGLFVIEDRGVQALKGVRDPIGLHRVVQPSGVRGRLATTAGRALTPFFGRQHECALLRDRFDRAQEGEGQVVLVVGEPGIGKSRLVQRLREELAGVPHTWLESGAAPYHANTPFYAVSELLKQLFIWQASDPPEARLAVLERGLAAAGLDTSEAVPLVAPLLELPVPPHYPPVLVAPDVARKRLLKTLVAWTLGAARQQPLVILLEDLQWADPSTLELQQLLVEQGATLPLLLLFTARPEFRPAWPLRAHHTQITLSRLPRHHTREMVTHLAARAGLGTPLLEALVGRADGVPLFAEELTKAVAESRVATAIAEIPETLQDSLVARLDRLGPQAREVAQVGAVCGREFSWPLLSAVHPVDPAALEAALDKLCDAELLFVRGIAPDATYLFKHALVQEAARETLLKSRLREIHTRVAQALLERFPEVAAAQPELLAHHYTEAGDARRAVEAWYKAGEQAVNRGGAAEEAARHLRRGLDVLALLPDGRERDASEFRLQLLLGFALMPSRGYTNAEVMQAHARAQALGAGLGDAEQVVTLLMGLWLSTYGRAGPLAAQPLADQVLALVEDAGLDHLRIWPHLAQGFTRFQAGELAGASEHLARGRACYQKGGAARLGIDPLAGILPFAALVAAHRGDADQARALSREAIAWGHETGLPGAAEWARVYAGVLFVLLRDPAGVAEQLEALGETGASIVHGEADMIEMLRGWLHAQDGRLAEASSLLRRVIEERLATGQRMALEWRLALLADVLGRLGQRDEALRVLDEAEQVLPGPSVHRPETLRLRAVLRAEADEAAGRKDAGAEVEELFRSALDLAEKQNARLLALRTATSFAGWLLRQGRPAAARDLLAPRYAALREGLDTTDARDAQALLALLDEQPAAQARPAAPG